MRVTNSDLTKISKYISLILRHKPEVIGIQLDANGWANVEALLAGIGRKYPIDFEVLEEIVRTDKNQLFIWSMQGRCSRMDTLFFYPPTVYG